MNPPNDNPNGAPDPAPQNQTDPAQPAAAPPAEEQNPTTETPLLPTDFAAIA